MSKWAFDLAKKNVHIEWNMFFANLGHNICDSHAGHMKRYYTRLASYSFLHLDKYEVRRRISSTCTLSRTFCRAWQYWATLIQSSSLPMTSTLAMKTLWSLLGIRLSRSIIISPMMESAWWNAATSKEKVLMWQKRRNNRMVCLFLGVLWLFILMLIVRFACGFDRLWRLLWWNRARWVCSMLQMSTTISLRLRRSWRIYARRWLSRNLVLRQLHLVARRFILYYLAVLQ